MNFGGHENSVNSNATLVSEFEKQLSNFQLIILKCKQRIRDFINYTRIESLLLLFLYFLICQKICQLRP